MGHGSTNIVDQYLKPLTPQIKATVEWVNAMLDQAGPDAWKNAMAVKWEKQEQRRKLRAKENSRRRKEAGRLAPPRSAQQVPHLPIDLDWGWAPRPAIATGGDPRRGENRRSSRP